MKIENGYISEIDGLRALAVMLVVVFHAVPAFAPGGFIGVDVFFVISGYVIARRYLDSLISREASFGAFYIARIRRLVPAALFVLLLSTVAALVLLPPDRLMLFAKSLIVQPISLQNFVFWYEGDYFDKPLTKPLLHTWSLAVEEQFYFAWAFVILLVRRFPRALVYTIVLLGLLSFAAGLGLSTRSPKTVFFMLPTRAWEFAFGILAHVIVCRLKLLRDVSPRTLMTIGNLAILVVLLSAVYFGEDSGFPGFQSALACLATSVALIAFSISSGRAQSPLNLLPIRYVGRVSYGYYLWHWPMLSFWFLTTGSPAPPGYAILLMMLAFAGAAFSYHFIETPIRSRRIIPQAHQQVAGFVLGGAAVVACATSILVSNGFLMRYPSDLRPYFLASSQRGVIRCGKVYPLLNPSSEMCPLVSGSEGSPKVLVLGDSHADVLKEMLAAAAKDAGIGISLTVRNCDLGSYGTTGFCSDSVLNKIIKQARSEGVSDVIAISFFRMNKLTLNSLKRDASRIRQAGMNLTLVETVPYSASYNPVARAQTARLGAKLQREGIARTEHEQNIAPLDSLFSEVAAQLSGVEVINPADVLCTNASCDFERAGIPLYFDDSHLTFTGAQALRPLFDPTFKRLATK